MTTLYEGLVLLIWKYAHTYVPFLVHYITKGLSKSEARWDGKTRRLWRCEFRPVGRKKTDIKLLDVLIKIGMKGSDNQLDISSFQGLMAYILTHHSWGTRDWRLYLMGKKNLDIL